MGLHRVFPDADIHGYDIEPQPNYPFRFVQTNVEWMIPADFLGYDFVWASPPCQAYSKATPDRSVHPDLIDFTRNLLIETGLPYAIENVDGAPILRQLLLCGPMFNLRTYRHRHFEANFPMEQPPHPPHLATVGWHPWNMVTVAGHGANCPSNVQTWRDVMDIQWAETRKELANAVPPAYSEYVAKEYAEWFGLTGGSR